MRFIARSDRDWRAHDVCEGKTASINEMLAMKKPFGCEDNMHLAY